MPVTIRESLLAMQLIEQFDCDFDWSLIVSEFKLNGGIALSRYWMASCETVKRASL